MTTDKYPFVSVIIPVFDDAERLRLCLEALRAQTYPRDACEILVIDNGSREDIMPLAGKYDRVKLLREPRPGSYAVRNLGLQAAKGPMIAFTDADCIPDNNWLEMGVYHFMNTPGCGLVAGKIDLLFDNPEKLSLAEIYEKHISFDQEFYINEKHFGATANLFTALDVIGKIGPFDARLKSGGDAQWGRKVSEYGLTLIYRADVRVKHPSRKRLRELMRKYRRLVGGFIEIEKRHPHPILSFLFGIRDDLNLIYLYRLLKRKKALTGRTILIKLLFVISLISITRLCERTFLFLGGTPKRR